MDRSHLEIEFTNSDSKTLVNILIAGYETITGRTLYPADPVRLFILWVADILIQQRTLIDFSAKQNIPRYAYGEYLDSIAEIFRDAYRLPAAAARVTLRFYISTTFNYKLVVPKGTRVTVDGEIDFATLEELKISEGATYGDVIAECLQEGTIGNGFVIGQITEIVDVFQYFPLLRISQKARTEQT